MDHPFDRPYNLTFDTKRLLVLESIHVTSNGKIAVAVLRGRERTGRMVRAFVSFIVKGEKGIVCRTKRLDRQLKQPRHRLTIPDWVRKELKRYTKQTLYVCDDN
ncbi:hypothetical protein ACFLY0_00900 [Patescibacteria group bacterium]